MAFSAEGPRFVTVKISVGEFTMIEIVNNDISFY